MLNWFKKIFSNNPEVVNETELFSIDEATQAAFGRITKRDHCSCIINETKAGRPQVPTLHVNVIEETDEWEKTKKYIAKIHNENRSTFEPSTFMPWEEWMQMFTLPSDIQILSHVTNIRLYGSHLQRLPPEIGHLNKLQNLDIYTSYSLHWLPYEVTRCRNLRESRMSTRALYGNRNTRLPFPRLRGFQKELSPSTCSVCDLPFGNRIPHRWWTTQRVGTDYVPLLVHSCSSACTESIPDSPKGFFQRPHKGGGGVGMPDEEKLN